jgi:hypothetical protein
MTKFYEIIGDEEELDRFLEILPNTDDSNQFYWALFARKKYFPDHPALKYDKQQLKRGTATKERLKNKLKQLECRIGGYVGNNNLPIPQESLALYISPAPRDMKRATLKCIKSFADLLEKDNSYNLHQEVLNVIQTTSGKDKFHIFDIDSKDISNLGDTLKMVDSKCRVVETRGGFHLLISSADVKEYSSKWDKNWYMNLKNRSDVVGDCLTPLCGCYQGGFIPKLII